MRVMTQIQMWLLAGFACLLSGPAAVAGVVTYAAPNGAPYNGDYRASVREQGGTWRDLFVYDAVAGPAGRHHIGFASFDSDGIDPRSCQDLVIENLMIDGKEIRNAEAGSFRVNSHVLDLNFR